MADYSFLFDHDPWALAIYNSVRQDNSQHVQSYWYLQTKAWKLLKDRHHD